MQNYERILIERYCNIFMSHKYLLSLVISTAFASTTFATSMTKVEVSGNTRIAEATINSYLTLKPGNQITEQEINDSVKNLFATGYFSDVNITNNGGVLKVLVVENPMINKIAFEGNKQLVDKDLLTELQMKQRQVFSSQKLQDDINRLRTLYARKGFYEAKITPQMIKVDQNRINLVYEIAEGDEARIGEIKFIGNNSFANSELKSILASQEKKWYRFFSSTDVYDADKTAYDIHLLKKFYQNNGYAAVGISNAITELNPAKDAFLITYIIKEGDVYNIGNINVKSDNKAIDVNQLKEHITLKQEAIFNQAEIDGNVDLLTDFLGEHGFPFSEVDVVPHLDHANKLVNVTFTVSESNRSYVNRIRIFNNTKTLDKVIRREFKIVEGDPYNTSKIKRSEQRLNNLGFFSKVNLTNRRTSQPDKVDIDVEVEETSTGALNVGVGYNSDSGMLGQVNLSENNFLGKGQYVSLTVGKSKKQSDQQFSFVEPYFMNLPVAAGFDLFNSNTNMKRESSYSLKRYGGGVHFSYDITEYLSHSVRYNLSLERTHGLQANASPFVKADGALKRVQSSSVGHTFTYDYLNNSMEPSNGYKLSFSQDISGLGGNIHNISHTATARFYYPLVKKYLVSSLRLTGATISSYNKKRLRLSDALYPGQDLIRGFEMGGFGPRDTASAHKDAIGAKNFAGVSFELRAPLEFIDDSVKGILFVDSGLAFGYDDLTAAEKIKFGNNSTIKNSRKIRVSSGPALEWKSPIGTIGISYAFPLRREKYDEVKRVHLNLGTHF